MTRPVNGQKGQRLPKGGGKGKEKGSKAKVQTSAFTGTCFTCGKVGHRATDCRRVQLLEEEGEVAIESVMPALKEEEPWVMPVESGDVVNNEALITVGAPMRTSVLRPGQRSTRCSVHSVRNARWRDS